MNQYGFVYLWRDKKYNRYYIGSHWGTEDDGYVCSSRWMKQAYAKRPDDFARKILKRIYSNRTELLQEEYRFLSMIQEDQLGKRYYNINNHKPGHWAIYENSRKTVGQKISEKNKANPNFGKWNAGKQLSEEVKQKISKSTSIAMIEYYKANPRSEATRNKISQNSTRLHAEGKIGTSGMKYSAETKQKMRDNNSMHNPIHVQKIRDVKRGIKYLKKDGKRKMAVPNTQKWNTLIAQGYEVGY
jgi:hypothetical protein